MNVLGIDFGGSGIKGNIVDTNTGELIEERHRIPTPQPASPEPVSEVVKQIAEHFNWKGPIGIGFPAVIQQGVAKTAANIDSEWINKNVEELITKITSCPCKVLNDADAAGYAEIKFGAGRDVNGLVLLMTIGTGIGTAIFSEGVLVPNTELGHIIMPNCEEAEKYCSDATRKEEDLKWSQWGKKFNKYLKYMDSLFWPDLIILGGGASKKMEKFKDQIHCKAKVVPAEMLNNAGIIGAAIAAKNL